MPEIKSIRVCNGAKFLEFAENKKIFLWDLCGNLTWEGSSKTELFAKNFTQRC